MTSAGEITSERLELYADLFINRRDCYMGVALAGHWICRKRPLNQRYLMAALAGEVALGHYSVDQQGMSRWACLDLDDTTQGPKLWRLVEQLDQPRQALMESSRRGHHLWLFVESAPWQQVRAWAAGLAHKAGLDGIEVFPKGGGLNGVRAPLTPHPKDGFVYPFIESSTGEIVEDPWSILVSRIRRRIPEHVPASGPHRERLPSARTNHNELVVLIEQYTELRHYGPERAIGHCPFHDDQHPSLSVLGGFWRCWAGCGEGGLAAFRSKLSSI